MSWVHADSRTQKLGTQKVKDSATWEPRIPKEQLKSPGSRRSNSGARESKGAWEFKRQKELKSVGSRGGRGGRSDLRSRELKSQELESRRTRESRVRGLRSRELRIRVGAGGLGNSGVEGLGSRKSGARGQNHEELETWEPQRKFFSIVVTVDLLIALLDDNFGTRSSQGKTLCNDYSLTTCQRTVGG